MKSLEQIAQKIFTEFAYRRSGMYLDWRYLSPERKLAWMKEVEETFQECLDYVKTDLKPYMQPAGSAASYEKGFIAGQAHEAKRIQEKIGAMKNQLQDQLERFKETNANNNEE